MPLFAVYERVLSYIWNSTRLVCIYMKREFYLFCDILVNVWITTENWPTAAELSNGIVNILGAITVTANYRTIDCKLMSLTLVIVMISPSRKPCGIGVVIVVGLMDATAVQLTGDL